MSSLTRPGELSARDARPATTAHQLSILPLGLGLSIFFVVSFAICVAGFYLLPQLPTAHGALAIPLPGFEFGSWPKFCLGAAESFAWGWYIALVFGPIYNFFAARCA